MHAQGLTIKANVSDLLLTIGTNRDLHHATFEQAQEVYRAAAIERLERRLADAREGRPTRHGLGLIEPADHTADYDHVLEHHHDAGGASIELDEETFGQYVLDDWRWKRAWLAAGSVPE